MSSRLAPVAGPDPNTVEATLVRPGHIALSLFLAVTLTEGCRESPAVHQPLTTLSITGSSTMAPLIAAIGKRFETRHPGIRVDVQTGGSSRGVADTRSGLAHIGMLSRALHTQEQRDLIGTLVARDRIGLIVHNTNPVERLTTQQVIDLYTGHTTNWQAVSAMDAPVVVVNKAEGHATLELFLRYFHLTHYRIQADVIIGDNEQGIKVVAGNPHAVGYVSMGSAEYGIRHGVPIKLIPLTPTPAASATGHTGRSAIVRPLTLVTTRHSPALARNFIAFASSSHVHDLVDAHYFVPLES